MATEEQMALAEIRYDIRKLSPERQKDYEEAYTAATDLLAAHGDLGNVAMQVVLLEHCIMLEQGGIQV